MENVSNFPLILLTFGTDLDVILVMISICHGYYRSLGKYVNQYLGIDYGEIHRMKDSQVDYVTNLYPLGSNTEGITLEYEPSFNLVIPESLNKCRCKFPWRLHKLYPARWA